MYHKVCKSLIYSNEKNEPHLFPYPRAVVHFIACYGYNVDRWNFPPKDGVSRPKSRPNGPNPIMPLCHHTRALIMPLCHHTRVFIMPPCHHTTAFIMPPCHHTRAFIMRRKDVRLGLLKVKNEPFSLGPS